MNGGGFTIDVRGNMNPVERVGFRAGCHCIERVFAKREGYSTKTERGRSEEEAKEGRILWW